MTADKVARPARVRYLVVMLRRLLGAALACGLMATTPSCGGGAKPVKTAKTKKQKKTERKVLLLDARTQARAGDIDAADQAYAAAYELEKDFAVLQERIAFLIQVGRVPRAEEVAKAFYDANPTAAKGYGLYAETLLAGGKGKEALDIADSMIALDEEDPIGHERRGRALILVDKPQEGIEALRKAVSLDPDLAASHMALGTALHKNGDVNEAALEFRAAVKSAPDDALANALLGMALRDQNEIDEGKQYLEKAIELDPNNGRAYFELGLLYNRTGNQQEAESSLSKAVQKSPNESTYWYAYGEIYRVQQRLDEAVNAYRRAVDLDPPHPKAITKLGKLLIERKQYDEAEAMLTSGIRRDKANAANYFNLAAVYAAKRKNKLAIENYQHFLELAPKNDPDRAEARDAIAKLKRR